MVSVHDILNYLESIAPQYMKMDWDNVGLLCGSSTKEVKKVLVALDPFEDVCREAVETGADMILTHHPLIFHSPNAITDDTSIGRCILMLAQHGICAVNAHTNLDCAAGGVNDVLAATLGLENINTIHKEGADFGLLRHGFVPVQNLYTFMDTIKNKLHCGNVRYVDGGKPVCHVAVGGGACGDGLMDVYDAGCDTFVTSDIKYNQFWDARDLGINLIDAGHFYTENPVTAVLADKLQAAFPEIDVKISQVHADCMKFY